MMKATLGSVVAVMLAASTSASVANSRCSTDSTGLNTCLGNVGAQYSPSEPTTDYQAPFGALEGSSGTSLSEDLAAIQNDVETAQSRADDAHNDAGAAQSRADYGVSRANTGITSASSAQTTANSAVSSASSAQTTADNALVAANDADRTDSEIKTLAEESMSNNDIGTVTTVSLGTDRYIGPSSEYDYYCVRRDTDSCQPDNDVYRTKSTCLAHASSTEHCVYLSTEHLCDVSQSEAEATVLSNLNLNRSYIDNLEVTREALSYGCVVEGEAFRNRVDAF